MGSTDEMTRRDFLKKTGAATLGAGLSTALGTETGWSQEKNYDTEINFLSTQDPFFFSIRELLPEFEEKTGIKVNLQGRSTTEIHAELVSSFVAGKSGLDVVTPDSMWLAQYADNDWIIPLTDMIRQDSDEVEPGDLIPEVVYSLNEWRGEIYTFPLASYSQLVFYRRDLLEKAGLRRPPKKPEDWWTWERYMEHVRELDQLQNTHGSVIVGAAPVPIVHMYTQLAASKGARWFKQFPEAPWDFNPLMNSDVNVESLQMYKELYDHSPQDSISYVWFDAGTAFATQDIGMYYWWTPYAYLMRRAGYMVEERSPNYGKFDYGVLPQAPGQNQIYSIGGWSAAIPRHSNKKEAAWELIKWMGSAETQRKMGLTKPKLFSDFPRHSLYEDDQILEHYPWLPVQKETIKNGNGKHVRPPVQLYKTLEGFYGTELNHVLAGNKSPEEALNATQSQFKTILKQNYFIPEYKASSYDDTIENTRELLDELSM